MTEGSHAPPPTVVGARFTGEMLSTFTAARLPLVLRHLAHLAG